MRFTCVVVLMILMGCGPTEKEKKEMEKEIFELKGQMLILMDESKHLVVDIDACKTHLSNITIGETKLKEIKDEMKTVTPGSAEEINLKHLEERILRTLAAEKEALDSKGDIDSIKQELQVYENKYDSLAQLLQEKTYLIEK